MFDFENEDLKTSDSKLNEGKRRLTRKSEPRCQKSAAEYCLSIFFIFVFHSRGINLHLHGSGEPPHSKSQKLAPHKILAIKIVIT